MKRVGECVYNLSLHLQRFVFDLCQPLFVIRILWKLTIWQWHEWMAKRQMKVSDRPIYTFLSFLFLHSLLPRASLTHDTAQLNSIEGISLTSGFFIQKERKKKHKREKDDNNSKKINKNWQNIASFSTCFNTHIQTNAHMIDWHGIRFMWQLVWTHNMPAEWQFCRLMSSLSLTLLLMSFSIRFFFGLSVHTNNFCCLFLFISAELCQWPCLIEPKWKGEREKDEEIKSKRN